MVLHLLRIYRLSRPMYERPSWELEWRFGDLRSKLSSLDYVNSCASAGIASKRRDYVFWHIRLRVYWGLWKKNLSKIHIWRGE